MTAGPAAGASGPGHRRVFFAEVASGRLARARSSGHALRVDEPQGIYRGEVLAIMGALADVAADVRRILWHIEGEDDEEEEEEDLPDA